MRHIFHTKFYLIFILIFLIVFSVVPVFSVQQNYFNDFTGRTGSPYGFTGVSNLVGSANASIEKENENEFLKIMPANQDVYQYLGSPLEEGAVGHVLKIRANGNENALKPNVNIYYRGASQTLFSLLVYSDHVNPFYQRFSTNWDIYNVNGKPFDSNEWHEFAWMIDRDNNKLTFFIDGVPQKINDSVLITPDVSLDNYYDSPAAINGLRMCSNSGGDQYIETATVYYDDVKIYPARSLDVTTSVDDFADNIAVDVGTYSIMFNNDMAWGNFNNDNVKLYKIENKKNVEIEPEDITFIKPFGSASSDAGKTTLNIALPELEPLTEYKVMLSDEIVDIFGNSAKNTFTFRTGVSDKMSLLQCALDELKYSVLTNESPAHIINNLNLLGPTLVGLSNKYSDVSILWKSDDESVISNAGDVTHGATSKDVNLTATLFYNGETAEKTFSFVVPSLTGENYTLVNDVFADPIMLDNWQCIKTGGKISVFNDKMVMKKSNNEENSCVATRYITDEQSPFVVKGEITAEIDWIADSHNKNSYINLYSRDDKNNFIAQIYESRNNFYKFQYSGGNAFKEMSSLIATGRKVNTKIKVNTLTNKAQLFHNGGLLADMDIVGNDDNINKISFSVGPDDNNRGVLFIERLVVCIPNATRLPMIYDQLNWDLVSKEAQNAVMWNLNLITDAIAGVKIEWSSSDDSVISSDGVVNRMETDSDVVLTAKIYKSENPAEYITKTFNITVKGYKPGNLAYKKPCKVSVANRDETVPENMTDGIYTTSFVSYGTETKGDLTVDLEEVKNISQITLYENFYLGDYNIKGYNINISEDGKKWDTIYSGTDICGKQEINFPPARARYVRLQVTDKKYAPIAIEEIEVRYNPTDSEIVEADVNVFKDEIPYIISNDINLPAKGVFGSDLLWSSDHPELVSNSGKYVKSPNKDTVVLLTLDICKGNIRKTIVLRHLCLGNGQNVSGGGSSGGGGSSVASNKSISNVVPYIPKTETQNDTVSQVNAPTDLSSVLWAKESIETLWKNNIVSGDGTGRFYPLNNVTREEFVKMLILCIGAESKQTNQLPFNDCKNTEWYYEYIRVAFENGLVMGVSDSEFGIGENITRQDIAVIVNRAIDKYGIEIESQNKMVSFKDEALINQYALNSVKTLSNLGIINGDTENKFNPYSFATRAEVAKILCQILNI